MMQDCKWMQSVGFSHLVEDGLAILGGRAIDDKRRKLVLDDLASLLESVTRGADLARNATFFVSSSDIEASESYSLFERHLNPRLKDEWVDLVDQTTTVMVEYRQNPAGAVVSVERRAVAERVLTEILSSVAIRRHGGNSLGSNEYRLGA